MASSTELSILLTAKNQTGSALTSVKGDLGDIDSKAKTAGGGLGSMGGKLLALGAGAAVVGGLTATFKGFWSAAQESNAVAAQTEAVIKSTGSAAGLTATQVGDLAEKISAKSLFDDETIQKGENLLLTFTNIGKDVFPAATQAATDMSQAMGMDMASAATLVGKALNDPIAGLGALSRVGVQFTEDQKAMIEGMVEAGDTAGAQSLIMAELNKQFGGSAEAALAAAGPTAELQKWWESMQETIGQKLIPVVNTLVQGFMGIIAVIQPVIEKMTESQPIMIGIAAAITALVVPALVAFAIAAWAAVAPLLPFIAAAAAVGIAVAALYLAWSTNFLGIQDITKTVMDFIQPYIETTVKYIKEIVDFYVTAWTLIITTAWGVIQTAFETVMPIIQTVVETVFPIIYTVVQTYIGLVKTEIETILAALQLLWDPFWNGLKAVIETVMPLILSVVQIGLWAVKDFIGPWLADVVALWDPIWNGLKATVDTAIGVAGAVGGVVGSVTTGLGDVYSAVSTKLTALRDEVWNPIWNGLKGTVDGVISAVTGAWNTVAGIINGGMGAAQSVINSAIDGYNSIPLLPDVGHISISGWVPYIGGGGGGGGGGGNQPYGLPGALDYGSSLTGGPSPPRVGTPTFGAGEDPFRVGTPTFGPGVGGYNPPHSGPPTAIETLLGIGAGAGPGANPLYSLLGPIGANTSQSGYGAKYGGTPGMDAAYAAKLAKEALTGVAPYSVSGLTDSQASAVKAAHAAAAAAAALLPSYQGDAGRTLSDFQRANGLRPDSLRFTDPAAYAAKHGAYLAPDGTFHYSADQQGGGMGNAGGGVFLDGHRVGKFLGWRHRRDAFNLRDPAAGAC